MNAEPAAYISAWVPGNSKTIHAENIAEYVDLIKACFDIDTAGMKSELAFKLKSEKDL